MGLVVELPSTPAPAPTAVSVLENCIAQTIKWRNSLTKLSSHMSQDGRHLIKQMKKQQTDQLFNLHVQLKHAHQAAENASLAAHREPSFQEMATLEQKMDNDALMAPDGSKTVEAVCEIDPSWMSVFLEGKRHMQNEQGCWLSRNSPAHPRGYQKINLRNTKDPRTGLKIGVSVWAHQLAVVAKGDGMRLRLTQDGVFNVSHRCHTPGCFNPEHVLMETNDENRARNDCRRSNRDENGNQVYPCTHGNLSCRQPCLLPSSQPAFNPSQYEDMSASDAVMEESCGHSDNHREASVEL